MKYLFLVPHNETGSWQVSTKGGKVIVTDNTNHFAGQMPVIVAGEFFLAANEVYDFEENLPKFEGV